jgi:hypothetical protein
MMQGLDGLELLKRVREDVTLRHTLRVSPL